METNRNIKVFGVRGSVPVAKADFLTYGGNTSCIRADRGGRVVILDAGSGLISLGDELWREGAKQIHILLSHLHMDHCIGLFSFRPMHDPEAEIHLYGPARDDMRFQESLTGLIGPPYWPLGLNDFAARILLHGITPGESFCLSGDDPSSPSLTVRTLSGNHPGGSLLFRLDGEGKSLVHALDCEMNEEMYRILTEFSRKTDLLIWDASYTDEELTRRRGWGHSSPRQGIALRRDAQAKKVLMTHYASSYTDDFLREQELQILKEDSESIFAKEGMEILI